LSSSTSSLSSSPSSSTLPSGSPLSTAALPIGVFVGTQVWGIFQIDFTILYPLFSAHIAFLVLFLLHVFCASLSHLSLTATLASPVGLHCLCGHLPHSHARPARRRAGRCAARPSRRCSG
jgi:hypothetical protein